MKYHSKIVIMVGIIGILLVIGYAVKLNLDYSYPPLKQKELLVYCGTTMIKPMAEIASIIEHQEGVKVSLIRGGSGNLLKAIQFNNLGDLFLPGSESYIEQARQMGLISETAHVGYNKAAIMVQKGNPRSIPNSLDVLKDNNFFVVIGNQDSGSIGKETQKILKAAGIYDEVLVNVREMTTDSKKLVDVLKNDEADLVINWYATATWAENRPYIDALEIDDKLVEKKKLVVGLLNSSRYPDIAKKMMDYAASKEGLSIFERYGLAGF